MKVDVVRAWKDAKYRRGLTPEQLAALPENPAGLIELTDEQLRVAGGVGDPREHDRLLQTTAPTCTQYSFLGWRACGCGVVTTAITCTMHSFGGWRQCCP